jgi:hypothetical protein
MRKGKAKYPKHWRASEFLEGQHECCDVEALTTNTRLGKTRMGVKGGVKVGKSRAKGRGKGRVGGTVAHTLWIRCRKRSSFRCSNASTSRTPTRARSVTLVSRALRQTAGSMSAQSVIVSDVTAALPLLQPPMSRQRRLTLCASSEAKHDSPSSPSLLSAKTTATKSKTIRIRNSE